MWAKRSLESSAAFLASLGRTKHCGTDNIAVMDKISFEQLFSHDAISILASCKDGKARM